MTDLPLTTYYKAVKPDGTDFRTGKVRWTASERPVTRRRTVRHPSSRKAVRGDHSTSLAVSTDPTWLPGAGWPMRLLTVVPVAGCPVIETDECKRQSVAWRVTGELPGHLRFGPMGEHVAALIEQVPQMTPEQVSQTHAAWDTAWAYGEAAWEAAWLAASVAGIDDAFAATRGVIRRKAASDVWDDTHLAWNAAARDAACALVLRHLIGQHGFTQEDYDILTRPIRLAGVTVHPDDKIISGSMPVSE